MAKKYHCKYGLTLECGEFSKDDVGWDDTLGLTDAFVMVSILRGGSKAHNGDLSVATISYDGQNSGSKIPDTELFTVWSMIANELSESEQCTTWQKAVAKAAFEETRRFVVKDKNK